MKTRVVAVSVCAGLVLCALSAPAVAQTKKSPPPPGAEPKANIAAMYSFEHNFGVNSPWGIAADFSEKIEQITPAMNIQVVAQFVFSHYTVGGSDLMFAGGTRFGLASHGNVLPYFHIIAGVTHWHDHGQNWFTTQFGGGVDVRFSALHKMRLRIEGNWITIFDDASNGFRLNAGVVIPVGKK